MFGRFKHSLRFKLTMILMIMMTLTVFVSLGVTQLCVKTYFLSNLKGHMIKTYQDINRVFAGEELSLVLDGQAHAVKQHKLKIF